MVVESVHNALYNIEDNRLFLADFIPIRKEDTYMPEFKVVSDYKLMGDQPQAVEKIADGILQGKRAQTLMGVTGSGKTFTMANIIERVQKPTLVISHNKTLAAQLHGEFKEFFPDNAVEYFVSYYDYYQPEAYVASTDTYIEKDSDINAEIEKLRHSATASLSERRYRSAEQKEYDECYNAHCSVHKLVPHFLTCGRQSAYDSCENYQ